jgi:hypothetical protein
VRRCSNLDYHTTYTVFPCADTSATKLLMFGPEMQTRKPLDDLAKALSARYTVVTFDLPGLGGWTRCKNLKSWWFSHRFCSAVSQRQRKADGRSLSKTRLRCGGKICSGRSSSDFVWNWNVCICHFESCCRNQGEARKKLTYFFSFFFFLSQTRKVFGLVLIGATKNHYRPSKLMLKGIGVLYKVCCFFS